MKNVVAVILAAGKSTRMKSETPKVLHPICGRPMITYVLDTVRAAGASRIVVVVGHKADQVKAALAEDSDVEFALQSEQLGTGHAVMVCEDNLASHDGPVFVLAGDTPLLCSDSLIEMFQVQQEQQAACVIGTAITAKNAGLGRIVRNGAGEFLRIVEEKEASDLERQIQEINTGCFVFDCQQLLSALRQIQPKNKQDEYYLTDCAEILLASGQRVTALPKLSIEEAMGVNTQEQLAEIERALQQQS